MSYSQQLANQGAQASDIRSNLLGRGQQRIADYDRDMQAYTGDLIAHRNGLAQLKTSNEMPRLLEEYMGIKPFTKKLVPALAQKSGLTKFLQDKFKGTKVEALQQNIKEGLSAAKEGRYGDLADAITGGKGAVGGVEQFAANALTKARSIVGDSTLPGEDAREAMNGWIKRTVGGVTKEVRQIGGAKFQSLSPEDRANVAKGSVDEDGVPFRPEELGRDDVYKGLTTGRFRLGKGGQLSDTATGSNFEATTSNKLLGGAKLRIKDGNFSLESEGGESFDASKAFGGDEDLGAYRAAQDINDTSRSFRGGPETQSRLDSLFRTERGAPVDFTGRSARPVQPDDAAGPAEEAGPAAPEVASAEQMAALRRGPQPVIRSRRRVSVSTNEDGTAPQRAADQDAARAARARGRAAEPEPEPQPSGLQPPTAAERAANTAGKRRVTRPVEPEPEEAGPAEEGPASDFVNRLSLRQPQELSGARGQSFSRDTPVADRPSGPYGSGRDAGTDRFTEPAAEEESSVARTAGSAFEPGSFSSKIEEGLSPLTRGFQSRAAEAPVSSMRGQYAKPLDSGRSDLGSDASQQLARPAAAAEKEQAFSGLKTFGKDVGKAELETAPVEEAEATLPGVGEVLMGLTAIGGVIKGAIQEHREKKEMDAEQITKPTNPNISGPSMPVSGVNFDSAPVIDSDDYHHL